MEPDGFVLTQGEGARVQEELLAPRHPSLWSAFTTHVAFDLAHVVVNTAHLRLVHVVVHIELDARADATRSDNDSNPYTGMVEVMAMINQLSNMA